MKYDIVTASSSADVVMKVQRLLDEGWELFGAPFSKDGMHPIAQAMILRPNTHDLLNGTNQDKNSAPG